MASLVKKIMLGILGSISLSYLLFAGVTAFINQMLLVENNVFTAFIVEHIFELCHLMGIILFILGLAALFKTVIYVKRVAYERQNLQRR